MAHVLFTLKHDDLRPTLQRLQHLGRDTTPVMRAMGTTFMSLTMGAFNGGTQYRPHAWAAKKDGSASNLQKSGVLSRSFHLTVGNGYATLANPTAYAARHQFGDEDYAATGKGMPPRPFYPVANNKLTPAASEKIHDAGLRQAQREISRG